MLLQSIYNFFSFFCKSSDCLPLLVVCNLGQDSEIERGYIWAVSKQAEVHNRCSVEKIFEAFMGGTFCRVPTYIYMTWLFSCNAEQAASLDKSSSKYFVLNQTTAQITFWVSDYMIYPRLKNRDELCNMEFLITPVHRSI